MFREIVKTMDLRSLSLMLCVAACAAEEPSETLADGASSEGSGESSGYEAPGRCGDQVCATGEDALGCPEDCNTCGDGVVAGAEACDDGVNDDPAYSPSRPVSVACTAECQRVAHCGDGSRNGPELCDEGGAQTAGCEADCRLPVCGDGVVNAAAGEGCDDADHEVGDGCSPDCVAERRVFATSVAYFGDMNRGVDDPEALDGIALADLRCDTLAHAAGLSGSYKAWLGAAGSAPAGRFDRGFTGRYRLLSFGFPVLARGWHDLVDGLLERDIGADERGEPVYGGVWSNTLADGTVASADDCAGWTDRGDVGETVGAVGSAEQADSQWTHHATRLCATANRLYCFEDR